MEFSQSRIGMRLLFSRVWYQYRVPSRTTARKLESILLPSGQNLQSHCFVILFLIILTINARNIAVEASSWSLATPTVGGGGGGGAHMLDDGRHSFSLSTFDPAGHLQQVHRAMQAASMGPPIVIVVKTQRKQQRRQRRRGRGRPIGWTGSLATAFQLEHEKKQEQLGLENISSKNDDDDDNNNNNNNNNDDDDDCVILMACPQILPHPLWMQDDDGTSRYVRLNNNIVVAHTGISADGRVAVAAMQRFITEHAYTFGDGNTDIASADTVLPNNMNNDQIPIELLLQEMALLFQEYTMKAATRPFGTQLLVAYMPDSFPSTHNDDNDVDVRPVLFRIDPSGNIEQLELHPVVMKEKDDADDIHDPCHVFVAAINPHNLHQGLDQLVATIATTPDTTTKTTNDNNNNNNTNVNVDTANSINNTQDQDRFATLRLRRIMVQWLRSSLSQQHTTRQQSVRVPSVVAAAAAAAQPPPNNNNNNDALSVSLSSPYNDDEEDWTIITCCLGRRGYFDIQRYPSSSLS